MIAWTNVGGPMRTLRAPTFCGAPGEPTGFPACEGVWYQKYQSIARLHGR